MPMNQPTGIRNVSRRKQTRVLSLLHGDDSTFNADDFATLQEMIRGCQAQFKRDGNKPKSNGKEMVQRSEFLGHLLIAQAYWWPKFGTGPLDDWQRTVVRDLCEEEPGSEAGKENELTCRYIKSTTVHIADTHRSTALGRAAGNRLVVLCAESA